MQSDLQDGVILLLDAAYTSWQASFKAGSTTTKILSVNLENKYHIIMQNFGEDTFGELHSISSLDGKM